MNRELSKMELVEGETGTGWAETGHRAKEAAALTWKAGWKIGNNRTSSE